MTVEPTLASGWEPLADGAGWRFNLRQGVTFQNGATFDAEDVVFSYERASDAVSDARSWFAPVSEVRVVDAYTVDFPTSAPVQDAARLDVNPDIKVIRGIEARVIMPGFAHDAEVLKFGADAGTPNPFRDVRVRAAVAQAINVPAIQQTIMRGSAEPASQLVSAAMRGYASARALLAEAGYPDGFSFGLKCTNDRYLNDEAVCQAVTAMLAQIGLKVQRYAMPVQTYWPALRGDRFDMYLPG